MISIRKCRILTLLRGGPSKPPDGLATDLTAAELVASAILVGVWPHHEPPQGWVPRLGGDVRDLPPREPAAVALRWRPKRRRQRAAPRAAARRRLSRDPSTEATHAILDRACGTPLRLLPRRLGQWRLRVRTTAARSNIPYYYRKAFAHALCRRGLDSRRR